jgi:hypothetical protein
MPSNVAVRVEKAVFTYTFSNTRPIELLDLTSSLLAIGEQYQSFMRTRSDAARRLLAVCARGSHR